jgi:fatty acid desaturase
MSSSLTERNNFIKELIDLREQTSLSHSKKDYCHLKKIIWINRLLLLVGFASAWIIPNPLSMIAISMALTSMWTIVAHHVLHGGYDSISNIPKRYHSAVFASGLRRYIDWPDWIYPPAWNYEHNILHHFFVNEALDPDQMAYRFAAIKPSGSRKKAKWKKQLQLIIRISFWKCSYYAFNTIKALEEKKSYQQDANFKKYRKTTFKKSIIPYITYHFILIPLLFYPLGWEASLFVLINRFGAELITNWHTFFIIVPNHTGSDLTLQEHHFSTKEEFYMAQFSSSCNFKTGGFWGDYLHGYLNYQIEHHLFPNLPAAQYTRLQPLVKSLCDKYQITYVQEPVFTRVKKLFAIILRKETMQFNTPISMSEENKKIVAS